MLSGADPQVPFKNGSNMPSSAPSHQLSKLCMTASLVSGLAFYLALLLSDHTSTSTEEAVMKIFGNLCGGSEPGQVELVENESAMVRMMTQS